MAYIEQEIMFQHEALKQTYSWFAANQAAVRDFMPEAGGGPLLFMGCGSSFMLAGAGAALFAMRTGLKTQAIAGGDYLINPEAYRKLLQDALVVVITRSGKTTEIDLAVDEIRRSSNARILCLHSCSGSAIPAKSDFEIPLDWAFDASVCQTRNITNFYFALVALYALQADDPVLFGQLRQVAEDNESFKLKYRQSLAAIGAGNWRQAVVLADAELSSLASEGALAFNEICIKPGVSYPLLDYRHGPMVLADAATLAIVAVRREALDYQLDLIRDLKQRGARIICLSSLGDIPGADLTVQIPDYPDFAVWGVPLINIAQIVALHKAFADNHDPDHPEGLDPYIVLDQH
ncbi:MAG TPA: hypothetical protein DD640_00800 [Clostridiales bacterium]|nr:hypothetical protein [Clostridiales bacterium]